MAKTGAGSTRAHNLRHFDSPLFLSGDGSWAKPGPTPSRPAVGLSSLDSSGPVYRILGWYPHHPKTRKTMVLASGRATVVARHTRSSLDIADIA